MIIKKTDISSIFPIIIKIIKLNFEVVSKLAKSIFSIPNIAEVVVFVIVKMDNLNDLIASCKVIIGESIIHPYYWSNRIYETIGRGGFCLHAYHEGIENEYTSLYEDLHKSRNTN